jgi:hypothetical protein
MRAFIAATIIAALAFPLTDCSKRRPTPSPPVVKDDNGKPIAPDMLNKIQVIEKRVEISTPILAMCKMETLRTYPKTTNWGPLGDPPSVFLLACMQSHAFRWAGDLRDSYYPCGTSADGAKGNYMPIDEPQCWVRS